MATALKAPAEYVQTQLFRAKGAEVVQLTAPLPTSFEPSLLVLAKDTAIVSTTWGNDGIEGVIFYDNQKASTHPSLCDLVEKNYQRLVETMRYGMAFTIPGYDNIRLIRIGDSIYVSERIYERRGGGCGAVAQSGLFANGTWTNMAKESISTGENGENKPFLKALFGLDIKKQMILGFNDDYTTLKFISMTGQSEKDSVVEGKASPWVWSFYNNTTLPRYDGSWIATSKCGDKYLSALDTRREEAQNKGFLYPPLNIAYHCSDLPSFRKYSNGQWRTIEHSLYGGEVWEDGNGDVWHFRVGEAEVFFADGRQQLIPLDSGQYNQFRLAIESPDAVWIKSAQFLRRMQLQRDSAGKPQKWEQTHIFRLPLLGNDFAGPWIAGQSLYYASQGSLFHTAIGELIGLSAKK